MSPENKTDGSISSEPNIDALVAQLSSLLADLLNAARATTDPVALIQLNNEYAAVQTILNQAVHAQLAADDIVFNQAVVGLKAQSKLLDGMETQIQSLVKDVGTAGKILGYITQAIAIIAKI